MYSDAPIKTYTVEKGYNILFTHVPTGRQVSFAAFLTSFSDNYSSTWVPDKIYGRTEPIYSFQQTTRTIDFGIDIPSADEVEGEVNLALVRNLTRFLYPAYQLTDGIANIIDDSPIIRIKFANLIGKGPDGIGEGNLLGRISTISVSPDIEAGFFDPFKVLYPKVLKLSISFDVIHEENPTRFPAEGSPVDPYAEDKATTGTATASFQFGDIDPNAITFADSTTTTSAQANGSENRVATSGLSPASDRLSDEEYQQLVANGDTIFFTSEWVGSDQEGGYLIDAAKTREAAANRRALDSPREINVDTSSLYADVSSREGQLDEQRVLG
jgi:hypothetical protein